MMFFQCYDCFFSVDGPAELGRLLNAKGFKDGSPDGADNLVGFRLEAVGSFFDLYQDDSILAEQQTLPLICEMVVTRVHPLLSQACPEYTFVRADTVQAPSGQGILLGGWTFTGKTRAAQKLMEAGASRWSEHYAVLDDTGALLPYPSANKPKEGLKVGALMGLAYRPESPWLVNTSTPGQGAMQLMPLVVGPAEGMAKALPRLAAASSSSSVRYFGRRGPAEQVLEALRETPAWATQ